MSNSLVETHDVRVYFGSKRRPLRAVDGVSLAVGRGESVGLVGESGCGKSTLGRAILRLEPLHSGQILFEGADIANFSGQRLKQFRRQAQMIFQDPFGSLNPRMSVGHAIEEVLQVHGERSSHVRQGRAEDLFRAVGLDPAYLRRYPHEFSGGQRQRIGIARALAVKPSLLVADEPVSALDVSVQVQILNLMKDLKQAMNLSYLFVAHDLAVVRYVSDRIVVMYLGKMVESAPANELYVRAAHPYTEALAFGGSGCQPRLESAEREVESDRAERGHPVGDAGDPGLSVSSALSPRKGPLSRRSPGPARGFGGP